MDGRARVPREDESRRPGLAFRCYPLLPFFGRFSIRAAAATTRRAGRSADVQRADAVPADPSQGSCVLCVTSRLILCRKLRLQFLLSMFHHMVVQYLG